MRHINLYIDIHAEYPDELLWIMDVDWPDGVTGAIMLPELWDVVKTSKICQEDIMDMKNVGRDLSIFVVGR